MEGTSIDTLAQAAVASLDSVNELLQAASTAADKSGPQDGLAVKQKKALLDSLAAKRFHRRYKEWEKTTKQQFVARDVAGYNSKVAQLARAYAHHESQQGKLDELQRAVRLPEFLLSAETLRQYQHGRLMPGEASGGRVPASVALSSVFSLAWESALPEPRLEEIRELVNIEYRLRMQCQIQNEVLLRLKSHLIAKNSQWSARDSKLSVFLTRDLRKVYEEVVATRASEKEDLKYYDVDSGEDRELEDGELDGELDGDSEERELEDRGSESEEQSEDQRSEDQESEDQELDEQSEDQGTEDQGTEDQEPGERELDEEEHDQQLQDKPDSEEQLQDMQDSEEQLQDKPDSEEQLQDMQDSEERQEKPGSEERQEKPGSEERQEKQDHEEQQSDQQMEEAEERESQGQQPQQWHAQESSTVDSKDHMLLD